LKSECITDSFFPMKKENRVQENKKKFVALRWSTHRQAHPFDGQEFMKADLYYRI
jgi:hypothetical protein